MSPGDHLLSATAGAESANALDVQALGPVAREALVPAPPGNLLAVASEGRVDLTWQDNSGNEDGFKVKRQGPADAGLIDIATLAPNQSSYSDTTVQPNTTYTYRVRAFNAAGGAASNDATVTSLAAVAAPTNLRALASEGRVDLTWQDNSNNEDGFKIKRQGPADQDLVDIATVGPNVTSYTDIGVQPNSTYAYRVRAFRNSGGGAASNDVVVTTPALVVAPSALRATASEGRVDLVWQDNSNNEDGFTVKRRVASETSFTDLATVGANVTSYTDTQAQPNTAYVYRVRAFRNAGGGAVSNDAMATTPAPVVSPSDLRASAGSGRVDLSWRDNSGDEDGFIVKRRLASEANFTDIATVGMNVTTYADAQVRPVTSYVYRVRAFRNAGGGANSNDASVTTPDSVALTFSPANGFEGSDVEITTTGVTTVGLVDVLFGAVSATEFVVAAASKVVAEAPVGMPASAPITLVYGDGRRLSTSVAFTLAPEGQRARITSFKPAKGPAGTQVTIVGINFVEVTRVKFGVNQAGRNGVDAAFQPVDDTKIIATVPGMINSPRFIKVKTRNRGGDVSDLQFTLTQFGAPEISGFSPASGYKEQRVTILGKNFFAVQAVKFGETAAGFIVDRDSQGTRIFTSVPILRRPEEGPLAVVISVTNETGTGDSAQIERTFTVTPLPKPEIDRIDPASGTEQTPVTIVGRNLIQLSDPPSSVEFFDGRDVGIARFSENATTIDTAVPVGALGAVKVTTPGGIASKDFTIIVPPKPEIASFDPASGAPGTRVTLIGRNFIGVANATVNGVDRGVFFGDKPALDLRPGSDFERIVTEVPATAPPGPVRIRVSGQGGVGESSTDFVVTSSMPLPPPIFLEAIDFRIVDPDPDGDDGSAPSAEASALAEAGPAMPLIISSACGDRPPANVGEATIRAGQIVIIRGKYNGERGTRINPSVKNLPPGATASFDPRQPVVSETVTVTINTAPSDPPMLYRLEIGGTVAATGQAVCPGIFRLTLLPPVRRVTLTATPESRTVAAGGSATYTVSLKRKNFDGVVALKVSGLPAGVSGSFDPGTLSGGQSSSTLTVKAARDAQPARDAQLTIGADVSSGVNVRSGQVKLSVASGLVLRPPKAVSGRVNRIFVEDATAPEGESNYRVVDASGRPVSGITIALAQVRPTRADLGLPQQGDPFFFDLPLLGLANTGDPRAIELLIDVAGAVESGPYRLLAKTGETESAGDLEIVSVASAEARELPRFAACLVSGQEDRQLPPEFPDPSPAALRAFQNGIGVTELLTQLGSILAAVLGGQKAVDPAPGRSADVGAAPQRQSKRRSSCGPQFTIPGGPAVLPPDADDDADGLRDPFEVALAKAFVPRYKISAGERSGTGFASFKPGEPRRLVDRFRPAEQPVVHFRVKPLGISRAQGKSFAVIQIDYLTLWTRDDGLATLPQFIRDALGPVLGIEGIFGHDNDEERSAVLVAAEVPAGQTSFPNDVSRYSAYEYYVAAHEGDAIFDQSTYLSPASPVAPNNPIQLFFSLSKHGTYEQNPEFLPLLDSIGRIAFPLVIRLAAGNPRLQAALAFLVNLVFFAFAVERFKDRGDLGALPANDDFIHVGEPERPIARATWINEEDRGQKDGSRNLKPKFEPLWSVVSAPVTSVELSLLPATLTLSGGKSASTTVTLKRTNFSGAVTLTVSGLPRGAGASFAPVAATGTTSVLTIATAVDTPAGTSTLTVAGSAAGLNIAPVSLSLVITTNIADPPAAPSNLTAMPISAGQINLAWQDNSAGESGFRVERRTGTQVYQAVATVGRDVAGFADTGVMPGITYTYRVRALAASGESSPSNEASATPPAKQKEFKDKEAKETAKETKAERKEFDKNRLKDSQDGKDLNKDGRDGKGLLGGEVRLLGLGGEAPEMEGRLSQVERAVAELREHFITRDLRPDLDPGYGSADPSAAGAEEQTTADKP